MDHGNIMDVLRSVLGRGGRHSTALIGFLPMQELLALNWDSGVCIIVIA